MKTAIFLGAGASAAEGAPTQSDLFKKYFRLIKRRGSIDNNKHEMELIKYFKLFFGIDVRNDSLNSTIFPTFEEALGILDLADIKNQSFINFSNINFTSDAPQINYIRFYLLILLGDILSHTSKKRETLHKKLVHNLRKLNLLDKTIFISTNYDIFCDNALLELYPKYELKVDYIVDFENYKEKTFLPPDASSIKYYKLHGSLNWFYCPTCNNLRISLDKTNTISILMKNPNDAHCIKCKSGYSPIIVPPSFFKDLSNPFLSEVWNKAENELLDVEHIIFCGYSFQDADIHVKYLIKRIQQNSRFSSKLKITVINNHKGKRKNDRDNELNRYKRFLGPHVDYTLYSFQQFATNPRIIMNLIKNT